MQATSARRRWNASYPTTLEGCPTCGKADMHELPVIKSILDICLKHAKANHVSKIIKRPARNRNFGDSLNTLNAIKNRRRS